MTSQEQAVDLIQSAYRHVCRMEDDVTAAHQLTAAIQLIAQAIEPRAGGALERVASHVARGLNDIERKREELFRLLHPDRAEFEKTGWPE